MQTQPELRTERLLLRPFTPGDAPAVKELAGDRDVAATTRLIPHPYEIGMAEAWIATHADKFQRGEFVTFAIVARNEGNLVGAIGLVLNQKHDRGELGYWIGKPFWGLGYCTEAARAVVRYGFESLALHRIYANHMTRNPASGRVMQKIGMRQEGQLRQHLKKWGQFEDIEVYGILRSEWRE